MAPPSLAMQQQLMQAPRMLLRRSLAQRPQVSSFRGRKGCAVACLIVYHNLGAGGAADNDEEAATTSMVSST